MDPAASVPIPPNLAARHARSSAGRAWLASLPDLVQSRLECWQLELDLPEGALPWSGHSGLVIPVRQPDGTPAAVKIAFPSEEARLERHALALWQGRGAVALLASDAGTCALLLERLDHQRPLSTVPMEAAVTAWANLMPQLSIRPDTQPLWQEFEHIAARAEQWSDDLPADWEQLGRPFPRWLLEAALEVCQTRGAVGRRSARDVLVHTNLHFQNILARPHSVQVGRSQTGQVEGGQEPAAVRYAAINPRPMIGEAEFAVAPLLWTRLSELPLNGALAGLHRRCANLCAAAGLNPEAAREWAIAREVANALANAATPERRDGMYRSLWVASTLAGNTLAGLPLPHQLPGLP